MSGRGFVYAGTVRFEFALRNLAAGNAPARYLAKRLACGHLVALGKGEAMTFKSRRKAEKFLEENTEFRGYVTESVRV